MIVLVTGSSWGMYPFQWGLEVMIGLMQVWIGVER